MIGKVAAEVLKLRTTRTFWALALSTFGLILLIVVLSLSLDDALRSRRGRGAIAALAPRASAAC